MKPDHDSTNGLSAIRGILLGALLGLLVWTLAIAVFLWLTSCATVTVVTGERAVVDKQDGVINVKAKTKEE